MEILGFKKYIKEVAVKAERVEAEATAAAEKLKKQLTQILGPRYVVRAVYSKSLGKSINLMIHDTKPANNIADNSPVHMKLMMYLSTNFGRDADLDKVEWDLSSRHYKQKQAGIKWRKIGSKKSIDDANDKLIDWFKKNKQALDSLLQEQ